jgi:hypothetical protein
LALPPEQQRALEEVLRHLKGVEAALARLLPRRDAPVKEKNDGSR